MEVKLCSRSIMHLRLASQLLQTLLSQRRFSASLSHPLSQTLPSLGTAALLPAPVTREALQHQRELCVLLAVDLVSLNSKATAQHCNYLARYI